MTVFPKNQIMQCVHYIWIAYKNIFLLDKRVSYIRFLVYIK